MIQWLAAVKGPAWVAKHKAAVVESYVKWRGTAKDKESTRRYAKEYYRKNAEQVRSKVRGAYQKRRAEEGTSAKRGLVYKEWTEEQRRKSRRVA